MKQWWQKFFTPIIGEIMFTPRAQQSQREVDQILKNVKLKKSARVLDLACGVGRHSVIFAKKDFEAVGLDYSKTFLEDAKKLAKKEKVRAQFVQGDMKNLKPHFQNGEFDLVASLFNSFGYFEIRSDDKIMLKEVFRVLKPGGQFVLNTLNGKGVATVLQQRAAVGREPIKNVFVIDLASYDKKRRKTVANWTVVDARKPKTQIHRSAFEQNVYTHSELKSLLRDAGFKIEKTWALLHGGKFSAKKSWHQTIVARKPL